MNLESKKVTKGTAKLIREFVYDNREELTIELKSFYQDVASMIDLQLRKPSSRRLSMDEILERIYNIEKYVLDAGACEFQQIFVK